MKAILSVLIITLLIASCKRDNPQPNCPANETFGNGSCNCIAWYEGNNCLTPMRQKWIGTYIGSTHINTGLSGHTDTFTFIADTSRIDFNYCTNKQFPFSIRNSREASFSWLSIKDSAGIPIIDSTTAISGVGVVSEDGKYATLTYTISPFVNNGYNPDSALIFTFEGTKQ